MFYRGRELRRLWEVKVYIGKPDAKKPKTRIEKVIAWNAVDAIRRCGEAKVAEQPVALGFVTWPETKGDQIFFIESTKGPTGEVVEFSLGEDGDWEE